MEPEEGGVEADAQGGDGREEHGGGRPRDAAPEDLGAVPAGGERGPEREEDEGRGGDGGVRGGGLGAGGEREGGDAERGQAAEGEGGAAGRAGGAEAPRGEAVAEAGHDEGGGHHPAVRGLEGGEGADRLPERVEARPDEPGGPRPAADERGERQGRADDGGPEVSGGAGHAFNPRSAACTGRAPGGAEGPSGRPGGLVRPARRMVCSPHLLSPRKESLAPSNHCFHPEGKRSAMEGKPCAAYAVVAGGRDSFRGAWRLGGHTIAPRVWIRAHGNPGVRGPDPRPRRWDPAATRRSAPPPDLGWLA